MLIQNLEPRSATRNLQVDRPRRTSPYARVLVPVDGSAQSEHPLALAVAIARASEARLHLAWARTPETKDRLARGGSSVRMGHLEALTEEVSDRLGEPACRAVLAGRPAEAIVRHIIESDVDLVVMASRGHGALWRLGIGSTTDALIRMSPVPVIVVRAPDEEEANLDRTPRLDEIVVALDGSDAAEAALGPALDLATLMHAGLTLLRVVETPVLPVNRGMFGVDLVRESAHVESRLAHAYLDRIAARLRAGGLAVNTAVREAPDPATGILRFVREADADLVAVGTRGAGRAPHLLRGRTAARLLHDADVPLLLTNPGMGLSRS